MANATVPRKAQHSDWFTFLRSAFINGLKAYGASLMVGAPCLPPLETWENGATSHQFARLYSSPSLPQAPAWRQA